MPFVVDRCGAPARALCRFGRSEARGSASAQPGAQREREAVFAPAVMALSRFAAVSLARRAVAPLRLAPALGASATHLRTGAARHAAKVSPAELTKILSERIANFSDQQDVQEVPARRGP